MDEDERRSLEHSLGSYWRGVPEKRKRTSILVDSGSEESDEVVLVKSCIKPGTKTTLLLPRTRKPINLDEPSDDEVLPPIWTPQQAALRPLKPLITNINTTVSISVTSSESGDDASEDNDDDEPDDGGEDAGFLTEDEIRAMALKLKDAQLPGNEKTRALYKKNWKSFVEYCALKRFPNPDESEPTENMWLVYFGYMIKDKKYKSAMSLYSSLSACFLHYWGSTLHYRCPRLRPAIVNLLAEESFQKKKASVFEAAQIAEFLAIDPDKTPATADYVAHLKMVVAHGIYGGLRLGAEMKKLQWKDIRRDESGLLVTFTRAKGRGLSKGQLASYLIPPHEDKSQCCVAAYDDYVRRLSARGITRSPDSSFWVQVLCKSNGKKEFRNQNMGRNLARAGIIRLDFC